MIFAAADTTQAAGTDQWLILAGFFAIVCLAAALAGAGAWLLDRWYERLDQRRAPGPLRRDHPAVMPWPLEQGVPDELHRPDGEVVR